MSLGGYFGGDGEIRTLHIESTRGLKSGKVLDIEAFCENSGPSVRHRKYKSHTKSHTKEKPHRPKPMG